MEKPVESVEIALRPKDVVIVPKSGVAKVGEFVSLYFDSINPALITVLTIDEIVRRDVFVR
jgi:hypothetical protein